MYLVFDTETTGKPRDYRGSIQDVNNWPRVVQLAWILCDESGTHLGSHSSLIKPDGFEIPAEATAIHGITTERALSQGMPIGDALLMFEAALEQAKTLVAHNISFDMPVLGAEFVRHSGNNPLAAVDRFCTMLEGTSLCRLKGAYGYKWPRLEELHKHLFGNAPERLHDALDDARSCAKCFFEMKRRETARRR